MKKNTDINLDTKLTAKFLIMEIIRFVLELAELASCDKINYV